MHLRLERVGEVLATGSAEWTRDDTMQYALAVGAGPDELSVTTEHSRGVTPRVLPTFAVILTQRAGLDPLARIGEVPLDAVIHIGQRVHAARAIPSTGRATVTTRLHSVADTGRHAVIEIASDLADADDGSPIAATTTTILVRGAGGFGGAAPASSQPVESGRDPDVVVDASTAPNQALLYRLTGDRNPLHSDPAVAKAMGFERPILHGLCTLGFAGRALIPALGGDPDRLERIEAVFSAPVVPGDPLTTSIWVDGASLRFSTAVADRVVLHGTARSRG